MIRAHCAGTRDYLRRNPTAQNAAAVRSLVATLAASLQRKGVQQITILSSPAGATVTIDDQPIGVTPWTGELSPGSHHALITLRGYIDAAHDFDLSPVEPLDLSVRLTQQQATAPLAPASTASAPSAPESRPAATRGPTLGVAPGSRSASAPQRSAAH